MTVVRKAPITHSDGRRVARIGIAALAAAALGLAGIHGTLAQDESSMPGEVVVAPEVTNEIAPAPDEPGGPLGEDAVVTEVTPSLLEVPTASMEDRADPVPEEIVTALEDVAAPVDLTAIFGEGFPFTEEAETASAIGGDITLGGTSGGTISVGDDGDVTIGGGVGRETSGQGAG